jgi:hypothetical protein
MKLNLGEGGSESTQPSSSDEFTGREESLERICPIKL